MAGEETTNQGNIRPEFNVATTGLNLDQSVNQISKGSLTYALNAAVENFDSNSVNYQNEPGNELCISFPEGYQLIGEHSIYEQNKHIFFLANPETGDSEIGYMLNNDCVYRTLINAVCLNFNINNPIHKVVHRITNCSTEIYWTDGLNPRRYLDIDNPPYTLAAGSDLCNKEYTDQLDCNRIKIQPNFSIPEIDIKTVRNGGELKAGTYQFAVQYSDVDGSGFSSYYSVTNPTPIADPQLTTPSLDYPVGKSIEVSVSNLDTSGQWQYFNLAVIKTINGATSVQVVGTYFIDEASKVITYTGQSTLDIALLDITEKYPYYEIAQDLTVVRDILVWDNLTSIDRINYQKIANNISLNWETYRIPANEDYSDELIATNYRGYLRDEVYAFEIVFLLKNGKQTDGFHIPGRPASQFDLDPIANTTADFAIDPDYYLGAVGYAPRWKIYNTGSVEGYSQGYSPASDYKGPYQYGKFSYWESTETYPCNTEVWGELSGQPIRHHKFPDVLISPIFESAFFTSPATMVMQKNAIFPLGVKIDINQIITLINNSDLTADQKADIEGFKIVRGDRSNNKSIVAKGILRNVGKYNREGTEYYYPNYPYNDVRQDPFLLSDSNAYTTNDEASRSSTCRQYTIIVNTLSSAGNFVVEYIDCYTNEITTKESTNLGEEFNLCSLSFPSPRIIAGEGCIRSNTYKTYSITSRTFSSTTFKVYKPDFNCVDESLVSTNITVAGFATITVNSLTYPEYVSGNKSYNIKETGSTGYNLCAPSQLDGFSQESVKYRQVFNSPETSFGQPFLGNILKLENVIFGAGKAHFVKVKDNAQYKLISVEAQEDAIKSSKDIASITGFNASAFFAAYQSYLTIYINGITRRNYGYSFNSIASYDYSNVINNNQVGNDGFLGVKQRKIDIAQYLIPGVQSAGDNHNINNFQRESSVYIKTSEGSRLLERTYYRYEICNTNVSSGLQRYSYTDIASGSYSIIDVPFNSCVSINSFTYPEKIEGNTNYTIIQSPGATIINNYNEPPILFPSDTPSLSPGGIPIIQDDSRFTLSSELNRGDCNKPEKEVHTNVVSYYASIKNDFVNQYGQIYSYDVVDTGYQRDINPVLAPLSETIFGGDTFISKFAFKTKLPFFIDNRVGAPDDSDVYYDELGNVAYPKYWYSSRSVLSDVTVNSINLKNFISVKAHNLDCPNSQVPETSPGRTYYDGKMYLFAYGVPYFYCESSYNVNLRQAYNNKEGDFWPHVSTGIPDDWVQESYVSIANDNTYYYNPTFSKQNRENVFTNLPIDWSPDLCATTYPFRAIYSDPQESDINNSVNNWLIYRALSRFDFPQNYGNLISLDGIQNKAVLARFENKSLLYNTLLTIDTSNPQAAYIGNNKLFQSAPAVDFAETDLGFVGTQNKMLLKIPQGQVTIDAKRGQVFLIGGSQGQVKDLTAFGSGMNRWFTDHLAFEILKYFPEVDTDNHFNGVGLHGVFDSKYDRILITKLDYVPKRDDIKYDPITKEFYIEHIYPGNCPSTTSTTTTSSGTTTTTTTINSCISGYTQIGFYTYIVNTETDTLTYFNTLSTEEACAVISIRNENPTIYGAGGFLAYISDFIVGGSAIYSNCNPVPDGTYLYSQNDYTIFTVVDGEIAQIVDCGMPMMLRSVSQTPNILSTGTTTTCPPIIIREVVYLTDEDYFCNKSWTVSFNLNTNTWISFHSYLPNFYIAENNFFYSGINDCCSQIDAIVATVGPEPPPPTTTTTTTNLIFDCNLYGYATDVTPPTTTTTSTTINCNLDGYATDVTPTTTTTSSTSTTTTTTTLNCNLEGYASTELTTTTSTTTLAPATIHWSNQEQLSPYVDSDLLIANEVVTIINETASNNGTFTTPAGTMLTAQQTSTTGDIGNYRLVVINVTDGITLYDNIDVPPTLPAVVNNFVFTVASGKTYSISASAALEITTTTTTSSTSSTTTSTSTTTTTTTQTPTTTTTTTLPPSIAWTTGGSGAGFGTSGAACATAIGGPTLYTANPYTGNGSVFYTDLALTTPFNGGSLWYKVYNVSGGYSLAVQINVSGVQVNSDSCATTTTTTSTSTSTSTTTTTTTATPTTTTTTTTATPTTTTTTTSSGVTVYYEGYSICAGEVVSFNIGGYDSCVGTSCSGVVYNVAVGTVLYASDTNGPKSGGLCLDVEAKIGTTAGGSEIAIDSQSGVGVTAEVYYTVNISSPSVIYLSAGLVS